MKFKVWLKSKAADRVLSPLRKELSNLVENGSSLLEVGCGTGDLLFQSASKISFGYGVDIDQDMIDYAESKRQKNNLSHLSFECVDALKIAPRQFDFSNSTLCLHELPEKKACELLEMMVNNSNLVLIADYTAAKSTLGKVSIEFDEMISGHYRNYRRYRKCGEIPSYAEKIGATVQQEIESVIEGISIWVISKNAMT
jgi:SAM-dependent methyltransferase